MYSASALCLASLFIIPSLASSIQNYFNVTYMSSYVNSGNAGGFDLFTMLLDDPATNTGTNCFARFDSKKSNTVDSHPPWEWTKCQDPTFTYRFETSDNDSSFRVGIRHQYRRNGIACEKSSGPECTTRMGYALFNSSAPGFNYYDSSNSRSEGASGELIANAGPFMAPVFSHCRSCAKNSIGGSG